MAIVGASAKPDRPSHQVMRYLLDAGYVVFPVNPALAGQTVLDCPVHASLEEVPDSIDMVVVFRQSRFLEAVVREAIALGIGIVWTQLGVVDPAATELAEGHGLEIVMDRCAAIERPRLQRMGLLTLTKSRRQSL